MSDRVTSKAGNRWRRGAGLYLTTAPFILIFLAFSLFPVMFSAYLGFASWDGFSDPSWVGLENYLGAWKDPIFRKAIWNTAYVWFWSTLLTIGLALGISVVINEYVTVGKGYFRMVFLLPLLVAPAVAAIILRVFFSSNGGIINQITGAITGEPSYFDWLGSESWIKPIVVLLVIWRWTGWYVIIFMAALPSIPRDIYEAARMDGVGRMSILTGITLPLLLPSIAFAVITSTIGGLQMFDEPYVLTDGLGGTNNSATTVGMYLFATAFTRLDFGMASAVSWYIFAAVVTFTLLYRKGLNRMGEKA